MQKDAKDILKNIKADMEGKSSKDISFNDLRKKTRKSKKKSEKKSESEKENNTIDNEEGFSVLNTETKFCEYSDIKAKRKIKDKENLEEWGAFDFFRFARKLYLKKYKEDWDLNITGNSVEINRIRDKIYDIFGYCCNLIMRDYIVYFFESHIDDFKNKQGDFYFNQMRKDWIIDSFREHYNFKERFVDYISNEKKKNILTKEEIEKSFSISDDNLVGNYGVVIALNWLLKIKKMSKKESVNIVMKSCKSLHEKKMLGMVKKTTEMYSPYPSNFLFKSPHLIFSKIDKRIKLNVSFSDNDKMKFLQKDI
jgi:hypothetical protein